jgi:hydroxyacylglutathione hydrolase
MLFRCIKSDGLAHHSYFVADGTEAVVIDPRRDVDVYLELARQGGYQIRWILETHRNEDYAIGSTALAAAAEAVPEAEIVHSGHLDFAYGSDVADGDSFTVGRLRFRVLETPGHTPESLTFCVADTSSGEDAIMAFTGDALFVGDTGRVDLLGPEQSAHMAGLLYDSLFHKILPLGDGVILYPGHGSGSVCGGAISDRDVSSIGLERLHNPGLNAGGLQAFVRRKLAEKHMVPPYFRRMEEWNQQGNAPIHERLPVPAALSPGELAERVAQGAVIVDARMPQAFAGGHIPGAYSIWREGLAAYLGWIVAPERPFVLVLPEDVAIEDVTRTLLRIGFDHVDGYLRGGFESWQNEGREIERHGTIDTADLASRLARDEEVTIVDVRAPGEWEQGTIDGASNIFVGELEKRQGELARDQPVVTMCSVGHRGAIAASILVKHGFREVYNYLGGYQAWCAHAAERPGLTARPPLPVHSVAQSASRRR